MPEPLTSEVWLVRSRTNPFPVHGEMAYAHGLVRLTITCNLASMTKGRKVAKQCKPILGV